MAADPRIRNLECFGTGLSDVRTPGGAREVRWRQLLGPYHGHIDTDTAKRMLTPESQRSRSRDSCRSKPLSMERNTGALIAPSRRRFSTSARSTRNASSRSAT